MTRQRKWQLKHMVSGLCDTCSEEAVYGGKCARHWLYMACYQRDLYRRRQSTARYTCLTSMINSGLELGRFDSRTKKRIKEKFGRAIDIREFMGHV